MCPSLMPAASPDCFIVVTMPHPGAAGVPGAPRGLLYGREVRRATIDAVRRIMVAEWGASRALLDAAARSGVAAARVAAGRWTPEGAAAAEAAPPQATPPAVPPPATSPSRPPADPIPMLSCVVTQPGHALSIPLDGGRTLPLRADDLPPGMLPPFNAPHLVGLTAILLVTEAGAVLPATDGRVDAGGVRTRAVELPPQLATGLEAGDMVQFARLETNVLAVRIVKGGGAVALAVAAVVRAAVVAATATAAPPGAAPPTAASPAVGPGFRRTPATTAAVVARLATASRGVAKPPHEAGARRTSGKRKPTLAPHFPTPPPQSPPDHMVPFVATEVPPLAKRKQRRVKKRAAVAAAAPTVAVAADTRAAVPAPPPPLAPPQPQSTRDAAAWQELLEVARTVVDADGGGAPVVIAITPHQRASVPVPLSLAALLPRRPGPGRYDVALIDGSNGGALYTGVDVVGEGGERALVWGRLGARLPLGALVEVTGDVGSGVLTVTRV